jgi:hypothetical protein
MAIREKGKLRDLGLVWFSNQVLSVSKMKKLSLFK